MKVAAIVDRASASMPRDRPFLLCLGIHTGSGGVTFSPYGWRTRPRSDITPEPQGATRERSGAAHGAGSLSRPVLAATPTLRVVHGRVGGREVGDGIVNGYYKAELIRGPARLGQWKTVKDVELATLGWVFWHNTSRLHSNLGDLPPSEYEQAYYAAQHSDPEDIGIQTAEFP